MSDKVVSDVDQFLKKAKRLVVKAATKGLTPNELYIVWFAKVLGNWKALVSTDSYNGLYWEVTYNGPMQVAYVDEYAKTSNTVVSDDDDN